jgi:integrase
VDTPGRPSGDWGSRGREFKSPQPDHKGARQSRRTQRRPRSSTRLVAAFRLGLVTGLRPVRVTGLRRREVLALRWDDVDLDGFSLSVSRQLAVERGRPSSSN